jgi:hypothetical protein
MQHGGGGRFDRLRPVPNEWDALGVGLLDNMKMAVALTREAASSLPKWGRIVGIERKLGRFTRITLEVHYGNESAVQTSTLTMVPRGMHPEIGQDVFVRRWQGEDPDTIGYEIEWHKPPQYGNANGLKAWGEARQPPPEREGGQAHVQDAD